VVDGKKYLQVDLVNQMILPVQARDLIVDGNTIPFSKRLVRADQQPGFPGSGYDLPTMRPGHEVIYEPFRFWFPMNGRIRLPANRLTNPPSRLR
jgi:hypothetical protein